MKFKSFNKNTYNLTINFLWESSWLFYDRLREGGGDMCNGEGYFLLLGFVYNFL